MNVLDIFGIALVVIGVLFYAIEIVGLFRYDYVLNKMHAAAIGDTLAAFCCLIGVALLMHDFYAGLKLVMIVLFLWLTSPVCSHLLARAELVTNDRFAEEMECDEHAGI